MNSAMAVKSLAMIEASMSSVLSLERPDPDLEPANLDPEPFDLRCRVLHLAPAIAPEREQGSGRQHPEALG